MATFETKKNYIHWRGRNQLIVFEIRSMTNILKKKIDKSWQRCQKKYNVKKFLFFFPITLFTLIFQ